MRNVDWRETINKALARLLFFGSRNRPFRLGTKSVLSYEGSRSNRHHQHRKTSKQVSAHTSSDREGDRMPTKTRPIEKFAAAVGRCSKEVIHHLDPGRKTDLMYSAVYGKCIVADYNNVQKDKYAAEFMKLQQCYTVSIYGTRLFVPYADN